MNYSINTEYFRSHLLVVIGSAAGIELSEKNKSEYPFGLFQWPLPGKGPAVEASARFRDRVIRVPIAAKPRMIIQKAALQNLCAATFPSVTSATSITSATLCRRLIPSSRRNQISLSAPHGTVRAVFPHTALQIVFSIPYLHHDSWRGYMFRPYFAKLFPS